MPQRLQAARLHASLESYRITEQRLDRTGASSPLPRTERDALALIVAAEKTEHPMTPGSLAATLGFTTPAVSNLLHRLQDAGLVVCEADPADRRRKTVHTTEEGRVACDTTTTVPPVQEFLMQVPPEQAQVVAAFLDELSTVIASQAERVPR